MLVHLTMSAHILSSCDIDKGHGVEYSLCKDRMVVVERHGYYRCTEFGRTGILISIIEVFQGECCSDSASSDNTQTPFKSDSFDLRFNFVLAMPSQNVILPSPPPVPNVPSTLWKQISLTAKTCCELAELDRDDDEAAGVPGMDPAGISYRWHLNE